ncbi:baseplate protein [Paraglaciecola Antarctic GD virus 1]|nr:baseplate protein [Paraglaciecola Antarctic GD virus 1]
MSLPILSSPHFSVTLPSGKSIKMRSMVMSEYKILMIAKESPANMPTAIIQVLSNCVMDEVTVTDLELCDIEYLFIQLHSSSTAKGSFTLKAKCSKCSEVNGIPINLETIKSSNKNFSGKTFNFDEVDITIGSPRFKDFIATPTGNDMDSTLGVIAVCITSVTHNGQVMKAEVDYTFDEAKTMIESLGIAEVLELSNYIKEIPRIELFTGYECKCGHKETVHIKGVNDFFAYL